MPLAAFVDDYKRLAQIVRDGRVRTFAYHRLALNEARFDLHRNLNRRVEGDDQGRNTTDFYGCVKVDNHIHLAAAASAFGFVEFVKKKLAGEGDTVVLGDGRTLAQVFSDARIDPDTINIDAFNVMADYSIYERFDKFNSKYRSVAGARCQ